MIKISRLADYAIIILNALHNCPEELVSATQLTKLTKLPEPTVSKILKLLAKKKIIQSVRGIKGGYQLLLPAHEISILQVIRAVDGPVSLTACSNRDPDPDCIIADSCALRGRWNGLNDQFTRILEQTTLADMFPDQRMTGS